MNLSALFRRDRTIRATALLMLAVWAAGCGEPAMDTQPAEVEWPLTVRYRLTTYDDQGQVASETEHEFHGRSWSDWTDIVVAGGDRERSDLSGTVQQASDGRYQAGRLKEPPTGAPFLDARHRSGFPSNARIDARVDERSSRAPHEAADETMAPGAAFNAAFAAEWPPESGMRRVGHEDLPQDRHSAVASDPEAVALRLGVEANDLRATAYESSSGAEKWASVYDVSANLPLELRWYLGDGTIHVMMVTAVDRGMQR